ncbi:hypothetical protein PACTADRAFT_49994 [Pachysolen tannophilus NRRL Y-2460]|uniref:CID domain-containing protein n=1 Tax=Pachysolen tannophilus NRRL Y-2460 TaxID=669874 RepID=A0A1E4TU26_PACTA|nr:hypothetical protein PACTADRAFT_49994 [Pachysolen tannophilus NRRL Y-2460]
MTDDDDLVANYVANLEDLKFNSRYIINNLTTIASENIDHADEIVKCIETRILKALPEYKLYSFYLLDSVSKNVGNPYNVLFGSKIYNLFIKTYSLVSDPIRIKLISLFKTWKFTTTNSGLPLFPQEEIDKIEQFLIRVTANNAKQITQQGLLKNLDEIIAMVNYRKSIAPPMDQLKIIEKLSALNDLRKIFALSKMTKDELLVAKESLDKNRLDENEKLKILQQQRQQILSPLNQNIPLVPQQQPLQQQHQPLQPPQQQQAQQLNTSQLSSILGNIKLNPSVLSNINDSGNGSSNPLGFSHNLSSLSNLLTKNNNTNNTNNTLNSNVENLFSSLKKSGLLNKLPPQESRNEKQQQPLVKITSPDVLRDILSTVKAASSTITTTTTASVSTALQNKSKEEILKNYSLKQEDIDKPLQQELVYLLYDYNAKKCGTCGKRFPSNQEETLSKHLDWHFRNNIKLKAINLNSKSIQSRSYYMDSLNFINFKESYENGDIADNTNNNTNDNAKVNNSSSNNNNNDNNNNSSKDSNNNSTTSMNTDNRSSPVSTRGGAGSNNKKTSNVQSSSGVSGTSESAEDSSSHYVIVPSDNTSMKTTCNICKETLNGKYNDDLGEWIWEDCISKNRKIYHWSCYQETLANTSNSSLKRKREEEENSNSNNVINIDFSRLNGIFNSGNSAGEEGFKAKREKI